MVKKIRNIRAFIIILSMLFIFIIFSYHFFANPKSEKSGDQIILIGVSQANLIDPWRLVMLDEIKKEVFKYPNIKLIIKDSYNNINAQLNDMQELLDFGCDIIIVSPIDSEIIGAAINKLNEKIPIILLDRLVDGYGYSVFIGPDNNMIGKNAGKAIISLANNSKTKVLEVMGDNSELLYQTRHEGFLESISGYEIESEILEIPDGQRDNAEDLILAMKDDINKFDIIFCYNDYLALGVCRALEKLQIDKKIVSIDGFDIENGGLRLLEKGIIDVNITCPTGGDVSISIARDIHNQERGIPKQYILRNYILTKDSLVDYHTRFMRNERELSKVKIGNVQIVDDSGWRNANKKSISDAAKKAGISIETISGDTREDQIKLIDYFIEEKVDIIILSPVVASGYEEILLKCKNNDIPVFLSDRLVTVGDDSLYYSFIGADFEEEGRRAANWLKSLKTQSIIFEIQGTNGASPTFSRHKGFVDSIYENANFQIIKSVFGNYSRESGYKEIMNYFKENKSVNFDTIYCHNDDMALGAINALQELNINPSNITIISIDGTKEALNSIVDGYLDCTIECTPLLGEQLIKAIKDYTSGVELPRKIITDEDIFYNENAKKAIPTRLY